MRLLTVLFVSGFVLLLSACKPKCDSSNCTGCCDASGSCQTGSTTLACGVSGASCQACSLGATCNLGACFGGVGAGGGTGGGTTGGGSATGGGSTSTGGGSATGGGGGTSDFCTDYYSAYIAYYVRCGAVTQAYATTEEAQFVESCRKSIPKGVSLGIITFDNAKLSACLSALRTLSCTAAVEDVCTADVVRGTLVAGADCYDHQECQPGLYCDERTTCPGACAARVAEGQPVVSGQLCVETAFDYGGTCRPFAASGQSCAPVGGNVNPLSCAAPSVCLPTEQCGPRPMKQSAGGACTSYSDCTVGALCTNNVCVAYGALNAACDPQHPCKTGLTCNDTNTCVEATPAALGQSCGLTQSCRSELFCNIASGMTTGTCATRRAAGATCSGNECATGLSCAYNTATTQVCTAPGGLGASCRYENFHNDCQQAFYCTGTSATPAGVCANDKQQGATCVEYNECLSDQCSVGKCTKPSCDRP